MSQISLPAPDPSVLARRSDIVKQLRKLAPEASMISDQEGRRTFESDALTAYRCLPLAVILPTTTQDVSKILHFCHENKVKVVPRGAGTSLSGGALPLEDAVVVCLSRMN
jgi:glycolate oxidase